MAFPRFRLPVSVEIAPGADPAGDPATWSWVDISSSVRLKPGIRITQGRADESARVAPSTCRLRLDNRSGDFTPRNPNGAYYGSLRRNTPLRVRIQWVRDTFSRSESNGWGTPDTGEAWSSSGGSASDYSVNGSSGLMSVNSTNVERQMLTETGWTQQQARLWCTVPVTPTGNPVNWGILLRWQDSSNYYWIDAQVNTDSTINLRLVKRVAGVLTQVTSVASGVTHSTTVPRAMRAQIFGDQIKAKLWSTDVVEPTAWQLETTDSDLTAGTQLGAVSRLMTGNTNGTVAFAFDNFVVDSTRFFGFVSSWPPRWDKSGNDATVPIEANGVLRRLGQGRTLRSPLYRSISSDSSPPIAYWPLEDESGTTQAATGLVGGTPLPIVPSTTIGTSLDPVTFGSYTSLAGAERTPDFASAALAGPVSGGSSTSWHFEFMLLFVYPASVGATPNRAVAYVNTSDSTLNRYVIMIPDDVGDAYGIFIDDGTGGSPSSTAGAATSGLDTSVWHHFALTAEQSGGNVVSKLYVDGVLEVTATLAGTLGQQLRVVLGNGFDYTQSFGHALTGNGLTLSSMSSAADGYAGEAAHTRIPRLCAEESIQYTSDASSSETMGIQDERTLSELLQECADADLGVLYETAFGVGFVSRAERYNRPVALTLDFDSGQAAEPPEPTDDDQQLRNRWTVRRRNGSRATAEDTDSIADVGLYDDETTVNVELDTVLYDHAAWRVHVGSDDSMRWPRIDLNLARADELIDDWLSCGVQSRVTASNPPDEVAGDPIDVIIEGYSEVLGYKDWLVSLNCSPAQPWTVATADGDEPADTDGATLTSSVTSSSTSFSVTSTGTVWSTAAADFPLDFAIGGERITVSAISGTSSPQTFTVSARSVNGITKAHDAGTAVNVWSPAYAAL